MFWVMFFASFYAQDKHTLTPAANWEDATQNSDEDAKKKAKKFWKTKGNDNIDSTKHFLGTKDFNPLIIKTDATERMRITSSGNIGIGTAVPNYPFEVQVPAFVKTLSADYVHISKGLTIGDLHFCRGNNCSVDTVHTTQQRDLLLRSNNLLGLIADTVKVASPVTNTTRFQIDGSVITRDLYLNSSGIQQGNLLMLGSNNKVTGIKIAVPAPNPFACNNPLILGWRKAKHLPLPFSPPPDSNAIVKSTLKGSVGIGLCAPTAKLHVVNIDQKDYSFWISTPTNSSDYPKFVITKTGNVGINTNTPQADLEIEATGNNPSFHVKQGTKTHLIVTEQGKVGIGTATPSILFEVRATNKPLIKAGNGTQTYFYINSTGQVGIGTDYIPSGFKFAVCGKVLSQEMEVQVAGWCDYVFEEDYKLMPWEDVVRYYKTRKHLPGVPSEKEVLKEGVELGKMNAILLQKIEELYLYIEQLEKRVKELEGNK